ncbi:MAG TPA: T9SS type A sorting domain-containing protein, partial [Candidatus Kapabacteria bacterium]|nr:T9SS type A sorting domain-containing protein [Candidatus Kapabacteria bacterium]
SGMNTQTLTITNNYQPGVGYLPGEMHPFSVRCIVSDVSGADTSLPYYPAYTPLDSASSFVRVQGASGLVADGDLERGMDFATQPLGDVMSVHLLTVAPVKDSAGNYVIELAGIPHGTLAFNHARLLALAHPAETRIGGTAWSGYHVEREAGGVWSEDTTRPYGAEELPLVGAEHSRLGDVTVSLADHDSLAAQLGGGEKLTLRFGDPVWRGDTVGVADSVVIADSTEAGWVREYLLELRGVYAPNGAVGARAAGVDGAAGIAGYGLEPPQPNPAGGRVLLRYRLGSAGGTRIDLLDGRGEVVRRLAAGEENRGDHEVPVDVSGLPSGMYFCRVTSGMWSGVRAIMVVR